jgi:branched-chain amino acid transport system substrate-binding protein
MLAIVAALATSAVACGGDDDKEASGGSTGKGSGASYENADQGVTTNAIKIGWIGDMTGPTAPTLVPVLEGVQSYFEMVNENGGINGRKVELISKNDEYTGPKAVAAFKELSENDKVLAIAGIGGSPGVAGTLSDVAKTDIPIVGSGQTIFPQMTTPNYWNLAANYLDVADVALEYAKTELNLDKPKVVTVALDAPSGLEWSEIVKNRCEKDLCEYTEHFAVPVGGQDFSAQAQEIDRIDPDFVMLHGTAGTATVMLNSMAKAGVTVPMAGTFPTTNARVWESTPAKQNEQFVGLHWVTPANVEADGSKEMHEAAKAAGFKAESTDFVHGWVTGMVLTEAMKNAGQELNRESLVKALGEIQGFETGGLTSPVSFDEEHHHGIKIPRPYTWDADAKEVVPVGEYDDWADAVTGEYESFLG